MVVARSLDYLRRFDRATARVEGTLAVFVLLSMVFVASAQALFFNLAEQGVGFGRTLLEALSWADAFLQKGTLWLAFLGASLATQENKHIAIDVVPRLVSPKIARWLAAFACLGSGLIAFLLAWVFFQACLVADAALPFDYEVLTSRGSLHVCDVGAAELGNTERPSVLCALRGALLGLGVPLTSGSGIAQLIAPVALVIIGVRLLLRATAAALGYEAPGVPHEAPGAPHEALGTPGEVKTAAAGADAEGPEVSP